MSTDDIIDNNIRKLVIEHNKRRIFRMGVLFPGTADEAQARSEGQAEVGEKLAGLINELNDFVGNSSVEKSTKKVSGKMGIEEMIDYLRIRIKDMVFDVECLHRELQMYIDNDEFNC